MSKAALADPRKAVQTYRTNEGFVEGRFFNARACEDDVQYTFVKKTVASSSGSDRSLIHNGKSESTVLIGCSEAGRGDGGHMHVLMIWSLVSW
jgi:hypothetical protein